MPAQFEFDTDSRKGTIHIKKGGQINTSKTISGNVVNFDSGGEVVNIIVPNPLATVNLAGIPFKGSDHDDVRGLLDFHRFKTGG